MNESKLLQDLLNERDSDAFDDAADLVLNPDDLDDYDTIGNILSGVKHGIELAAQLEAVRKISKNEEAEIYKLTFGVYGDDDGTMLFVGTEQGLADMMRLTPVEEN